MYNKTKTYKKDNQNLFKSIKTAYNIKELRLKLKLQTGARIHKRDKIRRQTGRKIPPPARTYAHTIRRTSRKHNASEGETF